MPTAAGSITAESSASMTVSLSPVSDPPIKLSPVDSKQILSSCIFCTKSRIWWRVEKTILRNGVQCTLTFHAAREAGKKMDGSADKDSPLLHWCHTEKLDSHTCSRRDYESRLVPTLSMGKSQMLLLLRLH